MYAGRPGFAAAQARLRSLLAAEGLPIGSMERTFNTRLAQELAAWAATKPGGEAVHDALFRAVFVREVNVAETDALVALAAEMGLPRDEARQVLAERRFADAVDADWDRARALGITGVPTFVVDRHGMVGAQPYDELEAFVRDLGARPRAL